MKKISRFFRGKALAPKLRNWLIVVLGILMVFQAPSAFSQTGHLEMKIDWDARVNDSTYVVVVSYVTETTQLSSDTLNLNGSLGYDPRAFRILTAWYDPDSRLEPVDEAWLQHRDEFSEIWVKYEEGKVTTQVDSGAVLKIGGLLVIIEDLHTRSSRKWHQMEPEPELKIFPNPVSRAKFTVSVRHPIESVQVLDFTGKVMWEVKNPDGGTVMDVHPPELRSGVYLVRVWTGGGVETRKVIFL